MKQYYHQRSCISDKQEQKKGPKIDPCGTLCGDLPMNFWRYLSSYAVYVGSDSLPEADRQTQQIRKYFI